MFQTWHTRRCYERTRGQLFCLLHHKALKRRDISGKHATSSAEAGKEETTADLGKVVNLMQYVMSGFFMLIQVFKVARGDAYAVAQRFWEFSGVFAAPVRLTIAMVFLYRYVLAAPEWLILSRIWPSVVYWDGAPWPLLLWYSLSGS
jgi:hypothetical protein